MRIIYIFLLFTLYWTYWEALVRLRHGQFPLTPILGWMAGMGYFMLIPLTVLVVNGGYTIPALYAANDQYSSVDLSTGTYVIPMLVIWLALLFSFLLVALLAPKPEPSGFPGQIHVDDLKLRRVLLLTLGLSLADYLVTIKMYGGLESFFLSHWYLRQEEMVSRLGDSFVLYERISLANQILFTSAAALNFARQVQRRKMDWGFSALIVFALILQMVMSGNRIFIALFGLAFLTSCWVYNRKKLIATLLIASPVLGLFFSAWAYLRHDLTTIAEDIPTYAQQDLGNRVTSTLVETTQGTSIMLLLHMVNDFGNKFDYLKGLTYSKAVTFILPRSLYPGKPENFPGLLAKLYEPGEVTSLGATQLGELYANFGPLSVLLLPLITVVLLLLSRKLTCNLEKYVLVSPVLFLLLIWSVLISFEDSFITFLFALLLIWILRLQRGLYCTGDVASTSQLP